MKPALKTVGKELDLFTRIFGDDPCRLNPAELSTSCLDELALQLKRYVDLQMDECGKDALESLVSRWTNSTLKSLSSPLEIMLPDLFYCTTDRMLLGMRELEYLVNQELSNREIRRKSASSKHKMFCIERARDLDLDIFRAYLHYSGFSLLAICDLRPAKVHLSKFFRQRESLFEVIDQFI